MKPMTLILVMHCVELNIWRAIVIGDWAMLYKCDMDGL